MPRGVSIDHQIIDGYTRIPPGTPDEWGDLERLTDECTDELLARLEAEEREAGYEPW